MELAERLYLSLDRLSLDQSVSTKLISFHDREEIKTRDWASLPGDLLVLVASRLTSLADFFAFRRVCTSWRSNVIPSAHTLSSQSPLIMLHVQNRLLYYHDRDVTYGMSEEDEEYLDRPSFDVFFLDAMHRRFYKSEPGSSWRSFNLLNFSHCYLTVALGNGHIQLRHFFTNDRIWLPKTRKPFSDKNIIFSENQSSPKCMFGLYSYYEHTIEFYEQWESTWKIWNLGNRILVMDMVFFERKAYALISIRFCLDVYQLAVFEFTPSFTFKLLGETTKFDQRPFLCSYGDELLLTYPRNIFCWDFRGNRWIPKSSLDGWAIFLSKNQLTTCINPNPGSWVKQNYRYYYDMDNYALMEFPAVHDGSDGFIKYVEYYVKKYGGADCRSWFIGRPVWIFLSVLLKLKRHFEEVGCLQVYILKIWKVFVNSLTFDVLCSPTKLLFKRYKRN